MSKGDPFQPPAIVDEDITWASHVLGLPTEAFRGKDGTDPRQEVLKSVAPMDIAACPGSGKTTLLVAKLAILAEKWRHRTRGICVLSHTNAARHEIETRLGSTAAGQRLLSYPHYIGTIHGFVNEFLALHLLRSHGVTSTQFSTEISGDKLWRLSKGAKPLKTYLEKSFGGLEEGELALRGAHYVGQDLDLRLKGIRSSKELKRSLASPTFARINGWKCTILQDGYAAYDDTFAYGHCMLKMHPGLASILRNRFPLLFIDEAQDNSEEQSAILYRAFMDGNSPVIRQRFGDCNQAIFDSSGEEEATTDRFACGGTRELPNSHRFGQGIATLVDPLGMIPYDCGLQGHGPRRPLASGRAEGKHTIFLFGDNGLGKVLRSYAELLLETFSEAELREGTFAAVGMIHRGEGDAHRPHRVGHYWTEYDPELARTEPKPPTLAQYVLAGQGRAQATGESYPAVEKIAEGILRLAGMAEGGGAVRQRGNAHRHVMALLEERADVKGRYEDFIITFAVKKESLTKETWTDGWRVTVREIAEAISGASLANDEANDFLEWRDRPDASGSHPAANSSRGNIYRYSKDGKEVAIQVGSIHSVKGQTHSATLVLETFWHKHNLESLLPWLCGSPGAGSADTRQEYRLKVHYVAMTRPTHLVCLAMKQSTFRGDPNHELVQKLIGRGWSIRWLDCPGNLVQTGRVGCQPAGPNRRLP